MTVDEQLAYLTKGCVDVVRPSELRLKLERSAASGRPLVVKVGFDPTAPDLHLGSHRAHSEDEALSGSRAHRGLRRRVVHRAHRRSDRPLEDAPGADARRRFGRTRRATRPRCSRSSIPRRPRCGSTASGSRRWAVTGGCASPRSTTLRRCSNAATSRNGTRPASLSRCTSSSIRWRRPTTRCISRPMSSSAAPISSSTSTSAAT